MSLLPALKHPRIPERPLLAIPNKAELMSSKEIPYKDFGRYAIALAKEVNAQGLLTEEGNDSRWKTHPDSDDAKTIQTLHAKCEEGNTYAIRAIDNNTGDSENFLARLNPEDTKGWFSWKQNSLDPTIRRISGMITKLKLRGPKELDPLCEDTSTKGWQRSFNGLSPLKYLVASMKEEDPVKVYKTLVAEAEAIRNIYQFDDSFNDSKRLLASPYLFRRGKRGANPETFRITDAENGAGIKVRMNPKNYEFISIERFSTNEKHNLPEISITGIESGESIGKAAVVKLTDPEGIGDKEFAVENLDGEIKKAKMRPKLSTLANIELETEDDKRFFAGLIGD